MADVWTEMETILLLEASTTEIATLLELPRVGLLIVTMALLTGTEPEVVAGTTEVR